MPEPQPTPTPDNTPRDQAPAQTTSSAAIPVATVATETQAQTPTHAGPQTYSGIPMPEGYDRERCMLPLFSAVLKSFAAKDTSHARDAVQKLGPNAGPALCDIIDHVINNSGRSPLVTIAELLSDRMGDKHAVSYLDQSAQAVLVDDYAKQLSSWSMRNRDDAAAALGLLNNAPNSGDAVKALIKTLDSRWNPLNWGIPFTDINARSEAANSLSHFGVEAVPAIPALTRGLKSWSSAMALTCMKTLQQIAKACKAAPGTVEPEVFKETLATLNAIEKHYYESRFSFTSKSFIMEVQNTQRILNRLKKAA